MISSQARYDRFNTVARLIPNALPPHHNEEQRVEMCSKTWKIRKCGAIEKRRYSQKPSDTNGFRR